MKSEQMENMRRWHMHWLASSTTTAHIPAKPGLYAIGHDTFEEGLESSRCYVYIGQGKNLRQRIGQHKPKTEAKKALRNYIIENIDNVKVWYTVDISISDLDEIEDILIKKFSPRYNIKGKIK